MSECLDCGQSVAPLPSGRVPKRHANGCPSSSRKPATTVPMDISELETADVTEVRDYQVQIAPYRWMRVDGTVVDGEGHTA